MSNVNRHHLPRGDILVVEDDKSDLKLLSGILRKAGYTVRPATDGELALRSVQAKLPALILLDILMPGLDGYETCRRLKDSEETRDIPVIFISAAASTMDKVKGFGIGGVDYITKPFEPEEVLARVATHLALWKAQKEIEEKNLQLQQDMTERQKMQERLEHLNLVLRALRNVNQLITRERGRDRLLKGVCSTLIETRGYYNAWTALFDENGRLVTHAEAGLGKDFLLMVELLKKGELTRCARKALGQADVVVTQDPISACRDCPLSQKCGGRGAMTARLEYSRKVYGLLGISTPTEFAADEQEQALLKEIAQDIASALHGIELEEERAKAQELAKESEERFRALVETTSDFIWEVDINGVYTYCSPKMKDLWGYAPEEMVGKTPFAVMTPEDREAMLEVFPALMESQRPFRGMESRSFDNDGRVIVIETSGVPFYDADGRLCGYRGISRDITERKRAEEALRESEEFRGSLLDNSPAAVLVANEDSSIRYVNRALEERTGFSAAELVGVKAPYPFWPEESRRETEEALRKAMVEGSHNVEMQFQRKNGERFWAEISGTPVVREGKYLYYLSNWVDVTERKRAEEEAVRQREYFKALFDGAPEAVLSIDMERRVLDINPAFEKLFGYALEDIKGKDIHSFILPQGKEREGKDFNRRASQGEIVAAETVRRAADGRGIPVSHLGAPVVVEGRQVGVLVIYRDITERKRAEAEIENQRKYFQALFQSAPEGIISLDLQYQVVDMNPAFEDMFGYTLDELKGRDPFDYVVPQDRTEEIPPIKKNLTQGKVSFVPDTVRKRADGSHFPASVLAAPIMIEGRQVGSFALFRDITERKRAEEERLRLEKLESVGTLAGGIAHDFNNLLVGILSNITLATRYLEPDSKAADSLMEAERASLQARDLTQRLLTFARGGEPVKKLVSLPDLLQDSATFALSGSNVRCRFSLPDDLRPVEADEGQMNQVIANLVINADEAMPEGGTVNIGARNIVIEPGSPLPLSEGKYVEISVEDHGTGIPRKHLSHIFDPYFSTKKKGSGLGLATAHSIVQKHGGHIAVESEPGAGTTFRIYLPASRKKTPPKKKKTAETPAAAMGRILVMDDSEIVRDALSRGLPSIGYEVEFAKEGAEAVERYARARETGRPFDAVILDLTVPGGMGGREAIQKLREIDPAVKAIVSSGYSTHPVMAYFKRYGFDDVVVKPYGLEELEEVLARVLTHTGNAQD